MTKNNCQNPEEHTDLHACALKDKPRTPAIDKVFADPQFVCENCGAKTHAAKNLCRPMPV